jgi:hypothetical protein
VAEVRFTEADDMPIASAIGTCDVVKLSSTSIVTKSNYCDATMAMSLRDIFDAAMTRSHKGEQP